MNEGITPGESLSGPKKMAAIFADMKPMGKDGTNTHHGYKFANESDLKDHIRPVLAKFGTYYTATAVGDPTITARQTKNGLAATQAVIGVRVRIRDANAADTDQVLAETLSYGMAIDTDDKAVSKAQQNAIKYGLIALLGLSTSEPEADAVSPVTEGDDKPAKPIDRAAPRRAAQGPTNAQTNRPAQQTTGKEPATQAQRDFISKLYTQKGITPEQFGKMRHAASRGYAKNMDELSKGDARNLIEAMKALSDAGDNGGPEDEYTGSTHQEGSSGPEFENQYTTEDEEVPF